MEQTEQNETKKTRKLKDGRSYVILNIDKNLKDRIKEKAKKEEMSLSTYLRLMIKSLAGDLDE